MAMTMDAVHRIVRQLTVLLPAVGNGLDVLVRGDIVDEIGGGVCSHRRVFT